MKFKFKYYMHDDYDSYERAEFIMEQIPELGMDIDEFVRLSSNPFYEIVLNCLLDSETGAITIESAAST